MSTLSAMVAPRCHNNNPDAVSDDKVGIMTTLGFQYLMMISVKAGLARGLNKMADILQAACSNTSP